MSIRQIVNIDEEKCNGCGDCVPACAEGAIQIIDGKAKLVADNLCDGVGACLGDCPEDAITIEEREADDFDEGAVTTHLNAVREPHEHHPVVAAAAPPLPHGHALSPGHGHDHGHAGCPSARVLNFDETPGRGSSDASTISGQSELRQWPIQLHLVPPTAPFFEKADVMLAADCVAFAIGDFHERHLKGKAIAIACPKLDQGMEVYLEKLVAMVDKARINTLTVMIMEVPCCSGLAQLAREAVSRASRKIPIRVVKIGLRGDVIADDWVMDSGADGAHSSAAR